MNLPSRTSKPNFLLDTGPLSVLCGFPLNDIAYINVILSYSELLLAEDVVKEILAAQRGKIARVISPLLKDNDITVLSTPNAPVILDHAYDKLLGIGERSTARQFPSAFLAHTLDRLS